MSIGMVFPFLSAPPVTFNVDPHSALMRNSFLAVLMIICGTLTAQMDSTETFEAIYDGMGMTFAVPAGYMEVAPISNGQFNWDRAYAHPTERFEVRYGLRPDAPDIGEAMVQMTLLNISGGEEIPYNFFPTGAVQQEFGADWGTVANVPVIAEFGGTFTRCLFIFLHNEGEGDAYAFFMADDPDRIPALMEPIFHNLRFAQR
jgi:hypothetical protein